MVTMNKAQQIKLKSLVKRHGKNETYLQARRRVWPGMMDEYVMIVFAGITIGIEKDGYSHT
jgi:hypothetical protein